MNASDLRKKSQDDLQSELVALRREQFNLRMQQATGETIRPHEHGKVRKNIARVKTIMAELKNAAKAEAAE